MICNLWLGDVWFSNFVLVENNEISRTRYLSNVRGFNFYHPNNSLSWPYFREKKYSPELNNMKQINRLHFFLFLQSSELLIVVKSTNWFCQLSRLGSIVLIELITAKETISIAPNTTVFCFFLESSYSLLFMYLAPKLVHSESNYLNKRSENHFSRT